MIDYKEDICEYFERVKAVLDSIRKDDLNLLMNLLVEARDRGSFVFVMGNGGSASTASHYVCDFNKGISYGKDKMFKFICLNDNLPTMMAYANDISYDEIFVGPLRNFLSEGDVVIGISGSGNSANVVKAIQYTNEHGGISVGITGFDGGKVKQLSRYNVHVPIDDMQVAEDLHMVLDHCMMKILSKCLH
jgi:D-sedoheptulose 7-phosphate isomerase